MKRTITLTVEQAKDLYEQDNSFRETLLSEFSDVELGIEKELKSWSELGNIWGYGVDQRTGGVIECIAASTHYKHNEFIFKTEKQALSSLAMAQLSQLMADLGDECDVDWGNSGEVKWTISRYCNTLEGKRAWETFNFLAFNTREIRDAFLEKHEELIKQYFMM